MRRQLIAVVALTGMLALMAVACGGGGAEVVSTPTTIPVRPVPGGTSPAVTPGDGGSEATVAPTVITPPNGEEIIEVTLQDRGRIYLFDPKGFTFKVGQKVKLVLTAETEFHTYTATDVPTVEGEKINAFVFGGQTVTLEFTPSEAGEFKLICTPHQAFGMVGTITVES